jgi:hypothetical protein
VRHNVEGFASSIKGVCERYGMLLRSLAPSSRCWVACSCAACTQQQMLLGAVSAMGHATVRWHDLAQPSTTMRIAADAAAFSARPSPPPLRRRVLRLASMRVSDILLPASSASTTCSISHLFSVWPIRM